VHSALVLAPRSCWHALWPELVFHCKEQIVQRVLCGGKGSPLALSQHEVGASMPGIDLQQLLQQLLALDKAEMCFVLISLFEQGLHLLVRGIACVDAHCCIFLAKGHPVWVCNAVVLRPRVRKIRSAYGRTDIECPKSRLIGIECNYYNGKLFFFFKFKSVY